MAPKLFLLPDQAWGQGADAPGVYEATEQLAPDLLKLIRQYGHGLGAQLGCGSYGCVWEIVKRRGGAATQPTPYAFKISADATEGPIIQAIINSGLDKQLDGLARWEAVRQVEGGIQTRFGWAHSIYVMVRESVGIPAQPLWLDQYQSERFKANDEAGWYRWRTQRLAWQNNELDMEEYNGVTTHLVRAAKQAAFDWNDPAVQSLLIQRDQEITKLNDNPMMAAIGEAVGLLTDEAGVLVRDLHDGNVGYRTHSWNGQRAPDPVPDLAAVRPPPMPGFLAGEPVAWPQYPLLIFDLGHSEAQETSVPALERVVRENPGLNALRASIPAL